MLIFLLSLTAMIVAALCCIYSRFPVIVRSLCVSYLILSTIIIVGATANYRGAPIYKRFVPNDIIIYGQYIDKKTGYINMLFSYNQHEEPSYIKVDYDLDLHKALDQGAKMAEGKAFRIKKDGNGSEGEEGDGKGKGKNGKGSGEKGSDGKGSTSQKSIPYKAYKLPPPILPQKDY